MSFVSLFSLPIHKYISQLYDDIHTCFLWLWTCLRLLLVDYSSAKTYVYKGVDSVKIPSDATKVTIKWPQSQNLSTPGSFSNLPYLKELILWNICMVVLPDLSQFADTLKVLILYDNDDLKINEPKKTIALRHLTNLTLIDTPKIHVIPTLCHHNVSTLYSYYESLK